MPQKITVVISQGQSAAPDKRKLEEDLVAALLFESHCEVTLVPNLYDLAADGTGALCLRGISGDMIVMSWLFPRAAHWTLASHGIRGRMGTTLLESSDADDDDAADDDAESGDADAANAAARGAQNGDGSGESSSRAIYHLDLRSPGKLESYLTEIKRIIAEARMQPLAILGGFPGPTAAAGQSPTIALSSDRLPATRANGSSGGHAAEIDFSVGGTAAPEVGRVASVNGIANGENGASLDGGLIPPGGPLKISETPDRRWYPVIDYSRCTNCMECIDFCLFGVYGVDRAEQILVEQPDNCRKGCPACSRVCPENAIIFPQHKSPAIAGSNEESAGGLKIDLSQLFGGASAIDVAAAERDEQLLAAGRDAVGLTVGIPKRRSGDDASPKDELDALMDKLDELPL